MMTTKRRVVITGLGIVSPIGNQIESAWQSLLQGKSGIRAITSFDTALFSTKFAGTVQDLDMGIYLSPKDSRRMDEFIQYGIAAGIQAVEDAGLASPDLAVEQKDEIGVMIGSGIGGLSTIVHCQNTYLEGGPRKISPFFIPGSIINMVSGNLSIRYGFRGPNLAVATACTTGTHCIGLGMQAILSGQANIVIAGGAEKASCPIGIGGFAAARALSTRNDSPEQASRPWDQNRDGFVVGDGSGVVVLEELESALSRGAKIYCEVVGFGMSGDAYHMTRPSGEGAVFSMNRAIRHAGISPEQIDYINAHATSTISGDQEELKSIHTVLGAQAAKKVSISSSKSMTGHLLGAAGAVEAIFTALAIRDQVAPPTINLDNLDPACDLGLDLVPFKAKKRNIEYAMSNSFGFGGTNGTLLFKRYS
jgi:3-oxoacyl-[acyl-carrier-protein] synthase II